MAKKIKVRVTIEVEIDHDSWELNYGTDETADEIREMVKQDADELVKAHFAQTGVLAKVGELT